MTTVAALYELCEVLDGSKEYNEEHQKHYQKILSGAKAGTNEKRLTSQLVVRYFSKFPSLSDQALDAMFEMCEDDDINIRKHVVKELSSLCKESGPHVSKIADVLVQLLQAQDSAENQLVQASLFTVLQAHPKATLSALFGHIMGAEEEELLRERAVKFLSSKLRDFNREMLTPDIENFIIEQSKKTLQDVTGEEFSSLIVLLSHLPHYQTVSGRQQLLDLITEQADLDKPPVEADYLDRIEQVVQCSKEAIPLFSRNVPSTRFVSFLLDQIFPVLNKLQIPDGDADTLQLEVLRVTADLSVFCGDVEHPDKYMTTVLTLLLDLLPLPPSEDGGETETNAEEPQLNFSRIECLILILHRLGRKHGAFFSDAERQATVKEFRRRLQYAARLIQVYSKKLRDVLASKQKTELANAENKLKLLALRTTINIQELIRDFLHIPPSYRASIVPSWKQSEQRTLDPPSANINRKRESASAASNENGNKAKTQRKEITVYQPPSGKFSEKVGSFPGDTQNGRGRGAFRRARGSWRGGRF